MSDNLAKKIERVHQATPEWTWDLMVRFHAGEDVPAMIAAAKVAADAQRYEREVGHAVGFVYSPLPELLVP